MKKVFSIILGFWSIGMVFSQSQPPLSKNAYPASPDFFILQIDQIKLTQSSLQTELELYLKVGAQCQVQNFVPPFGRYSQESGSTITISKEKPFSYLDSTRMNARFVFSSFLFSRGKCDRLVLYVWKKMETKHSSKEKNDLTKLPSWILPISIENIPEGKPFFSEEKPLGDILVHYSLFPGYIHQPKQNINEKVQTYLAFADEQLPDEYKLALNIESLFIKKPNLKKTYYIEIKLCGNRLQENPLSLDGQGIVFQNDHTFNFSPKKNLGNFLFLPMTDYCEPDEPWSLAFYLLSEDQKVVGKNLFWLNDFSQLQTLTLLGAEDHYIKLFEPVINSRRRPSEWFLENPHLTFLLKAKLVLIRIKLYSSKKK